MNRADTEITFEVTNILTSRDGHVNVYHSFTNLEEIETYVFDATLKIEGENEIMAAPSDETFSIFNVGDGFKTPQDAKFSIEVKDTADSSFNESFTQTIKIPNPPTNNALIVGITLFSVGAAIVIGYAVLRLFKRNK